MKKVLSLIMIALSTVSFVACGSSKNEGGTSENKTIKVAAWNVAADALEAEIPKFEEKHPDVNIEVVRVDADYSKITPALAAGTGAPDIIQVNGKDFQAFLSKFPNQFVDITKDIESVKKDFAEFTWTNVSSEDKIYALPWDIGPAGLFYRKDMFEEAGIDTNNIKTWEQYIEEGKKLKEKFPDASMTGYDESTGFYTIFLNQLGGNFVKDGKINTQSEESKKALSLLKKMKDEGVSIPVKDWDGRITALSNNKIASLFTPVWYAGTLQSAVEQQSGKWGILPLPAFEEGGVNQANSGGSVLAVTSQSEYPKEVVEFIKYVLATNEGQQVMMDHALFSSYTPIYDTDEFKVTNEYFDMDINSFFAKETENLLPMDFGPIMLDAQKPLLDMVSSVLNGEDIDEATKNADESISKITGMEIYK